MTTFLVCVGIVDNMKVYHANLAHALNPSAKPWEAPVIYPDRVQVIRISGFGRTRAAGVPAQEVDG